MKSKIFGYFIIITIVLLIGVTYLENVVYNEVENDKIVAIDSTTVDSLLVDSVAVDTVKID